MDDRRPGTGSSELAAFVRSYAPERLDRIRFAWNGKHAAEFEDANQEFRFDVVDHVCANPGAASPQLLADLFSESAAWAREAWGAPRNFEVLGATLLARGGEDLLPAFLDGLRASFDTYGACHQMDLDPALTRRLLRACEAQVAKVTDSERPAWEAGRELFATLAAGTATQGWVRVAGGAPVENVRVVPRRELAARRLWGRLRAWLGGGRT